MTSQNTWTIENADATFLKVAIQDSTGDPSAVEAFVNTLTQAGYRNIQVYKAWPEPLEVTTLVAQQGDIKGAQAIRQFLGFGDVLVESTGALQSDVTIRLGKDWLEKKAQSGGAAEVFLNWIITGVCVGTQQCCVLFFSVGRDGGDRCPLLFCW